MVSKSLDACRRKQPRQSRSKQTVAVIMEATAQILISQGYQGTTTAKVAERAGVSIGSVYQYFPNKDALLFALLEKHSTEMLNSIQVAIAKNSSSDLKCGLRAIVKAVASAHYSRPELHKVLTEQVHNVGAQSLAKYTHLMIVQHIENLLLPNTSLIRTPVDVTVAAVVIETSLEALIHRAVVERTELFPWSVFEDQTLQLITGYLGISEAIATTCTMKTQSALIEAGIDGNLALP